MRFYRQFSSLLAALALLLAVYVLPTAALAADSVYSVGGIKVDVTAETATTAREAAIAEGHQKALQALFRRLVVEQDLARVPQLSPAQIEPLVRDFSVADERTSAVRYLADMTFRFQPDAIRTLLRQQSIRFAETQSRPMLVLAISESPAGTLLWEDPNPWRRTWSARSGAGDLVPLVAPVGDLADIATVDAAEAVAGNPVPLQAIARRYGTERVLISTAAVSGDFAQGSGSAKVSNVLFKSDQASPLGSTSFRQQPEEDEARFLDRIADTIAGELQREWKAQNVIEFGTRGELLVAVPFRSLNEWLAIQTRLDGLPTIEAANLVNLSRSKAQINLQYYGGLPQLTTALADRGLILAPALTEEWMLRLDTRVSTQTTQ